MPRRNTKTPRTGALYRDHVPVMSGHRTIRIGAYEPREDQTTGVTLGLGYKDPDSFARMSVELKEDEWKKVQACVKKAFAARRQKQAEAAAAEVGVTSSTSKPEPEPKPATPPTGTRRVRGRAK